MAGYLIAEGLKALFRRHARRTLLKVLRGKIEAGLADPARYTALLLDPEPLQRRAQGEQLDRDPGTGGVQQ
jgi:hypothetical protein